jgi:hypothetical protein
MPTAYERLHTFTGSNGIEITISRQSADADVYLLGTRATDRGGETHATASAAGIEALREFFQDALDQQFGRWRWPEDPDFVVYPDTEDPGGEGLKGGVSVLCESRGEVDWFTREAAQQGRNSNVMTAQAAIAYFREHPEPKPWHDAAEGELWILRMTNTENGLPYVAVRDTDGVTDIGPRFFRVPAPSRFTPGRFPSEFMDGRRLWPEATS